MKKHHDKFRRIEEMSKRQENTQNTNKGGKGTNSLLSVLQCMQHISLSTQHYFHYKLNVYELVYYLACGPSSPRLL